MVTASSHLTSPIAEQPRHRRYLSEDGQLTVRLSYLATHQPEILYTGNATQPAFAPGLTRTEELATIARGSTQFDVTTRDLLREINKTALDKKFGVCLDLISPPINHDAPGSLQLASDVPDKYLALAEYLTLCAPFCIELSDEQGKKVTTTLVFHLQLVRTSEKSHREAVEDYLDNLDFDDCSVSSAGSSSDIASWVKVTSGESDCPTWIEESVRPPSRAPAVRSWRLGSESLDVLYTDVPVRLLPVKPAQQIRNRIMDMLHLTNLKRQPLSNRFITMLTLLMTQTRATSTRQYPALMPTIIREPAWPMTYPWIRLPYTLARRQAEYHIKELTGSCCRHSTDAIALDGTDKAVVLSHINDYSGCFF